MLHIATGKPTHRIAAGQRNQYRLDAAARAVTTLGCSLLLRRWGASAAGNSAAADLLAAVRQVHRYANRQPIAKPDSGANLHILVSGWALRVEYLPDGSHQIVDVLVPGDSWTNSPPNALDACGPVTIAIVDLSALSPSTRMLVDRGCHAARREEMERLRSRIVSLGQRAARGRLCHFIAETHARLATVGLADDRGFACPLTQEQLGDTLGLTAVHINRTLRRLRDEGLVTIAKGRFEMLDLSDVHEAGGIA